MSEEFEPDNSGPFKLGNTAWKQRSSHGRKPLFATPEDLLKACEEYFQWVEDNPLVAAEPVKFQGVGTIMHVPKMRAMTIVGLCNYLDIVRSTWSDYRDKKDFSAIVARVEGIIYQQKLEGAAAEMLNSNIIARDLGLAEKATGPSDSAADALRELAERLPD